MRQIKIKRILTVCDEKFVSAFEVERETGNRLLTDGYNGDEKLK
jgi:hypothetical protein